VIRTIIVLWNILSRNLLPNLGKRVCQPEEETLSTAAPVTNVVLVPGAFVDGSGWQPVLSR
jgi:hypothetical protein